MIDVASDAFLTSARWRRFRERIMRRDGYECQRCKRYGRHTPATEVHHIKHRDDHPELALDPDNCVSLCHACHNAMHPEKSRKLNASRYC